MLTVAHPVDQTLRAAILDEYEVASRRAAPRWA
jgi:hypothetical protein